MNNLQDLFPLGLQPNLIMDLPTPMLKNGKHQPMKRIGEKNSKVLGNVGLRRSRSEAVFTIQTPRN